ncbi:unnamed protein product [Protopolystoma xenopodis]|uniref:Uncharacterized protein n=1 Tax=Protopolystoma xenopodis TaxID=117903 RepID=A0A3S5BDI9_9PLAT|nr:unnamed protein product [Protopolystoma xenopodis]
MGPVSSSPAQRRGRLSEMVSSADLLYRQSLGIFGHEGFIQPDNCLNLVSNDPRSLLAQDCDRSRFLWSEGEKLLLGL